MSWFWYDIVLPVVVVLSLFAFACFVVLGIDYVDCRSFSAATGYETTYKFGCYAKVGDNWVPKSFVFGHAVDVRGTK